MSNIAVPMAPEKVGLMGKIKPEDRKSSLKKFLNEVLKLSNIQSCEYFRDFFYLNDIRADIKIPKEVEIYDFRDEFKYDAIVEGEGPGMMSTLLKKVDVFGLTKDFLA